MRPAPTPRFRLAILACLLAAVLIAACGDDAEDTTTSASTETTATGTSAAEPEPAKVTLGVAQSEPGEELEYAESARVRAKDRVAIRVAAREVPEAGSLVTISIARGASGELEVTASGGENDAKAAFESETDAEVEIVDVRYTCTMPPRTVCPAERAEQTDDAYELAFPVTKESPPIVISAAVS